ncbi:hypothetical protein SK128_009169 [Halocaridina rubra]|uniref:Uncharacterized protein n=1 Tax=Halocaridina rubra TaxID=373956 RepID=A0AAN8XLP9_HALRR
MEESEEINLTPQELQVLSELDSRQFGFVKLNNDPANSKKRALVLKAVRYLESLIIQANNNKNNNSGGKENSGIIDCDGVNMKKGGLSSPLSIKEEVDIFSPNTTSSKSSEITILKEEGLDEDNNLQNPLPVYSLYYFGSVI